MMFSILLNPQNAEIVYPQGTCSSIFVAEEVSELFVHPSIFLIKDSMLACIAFYLASNID